ncbi:uncharacterized protein LOC131438917 [Malaya genurostris]|uniref:uncharacterized protein LOC131438917 n=1 Tax=Malaya genurostris TaxID=325434 RepID=UPI0026F3C92F|nr:uncharacterized protein LOC131438917 [Malaya genurostris]
MDLSSEEIVDSSQKSCKGNPRGTTSRSRTLRQTKYRSQRQFTPRVTRQNASKKQSSCVLEIPESSEENTSSANISGSLFNGQQELLKQYQQHDESLKERDEVLEKVLEQSRKVYEQLKLQNETRKLFSDNTAVNNAETCCSSQDVNTGALLNSKDEINFKHIGVQTEQPKLQHQTVALSPIRQPSVYKNAALQLSPLKMPNQATTSVGCNTGTTILADATVQTVLLETRNIGVQKYHSTRVREAYAQTRTEELRRHVAKRNVCIQHRSYEMLELTTDCALNLGLEMKCDPARLLRMMLRLASKQNNPNESSNSSATADLTPDDPYYANYEYFMGETPDEGTVSHSDVGEIKMESSCVGEEFY